MGCQRWSPLSLLCQRLESAQLLHSAEVLAHGWPPWKSRIRLFRKRLPVNWQPNRSQIENLLSVLFWILTDPH